MVFTYLRAFGGGGGSVKITFHDTQILHKIQISLSVNKVLLEQAMFIHLPLPTDCFHTYNGRTEQL